MVAMNVYAKSTIACVPGISLSCSSYISSFSVCLPSVTLLRETLLVLIPVVILRRLSKKILMVFALNIDKFASFKTSNDTVRVRKNGKSSVFVPTGTVGLFAIEPDIGLMRGLQSIRFGSQIPAPVAY
jgi:hypothetical protein